MSVSVCVLCIVFQAILDLDYEENFKLIDTRLVISTTAVAFALFALAWDYFYPFPASRSVLLICAVSFVILLFTTFKIVSIYYHEILVINRRLHECKQSKT